MNPRRLAAVLLLTATTVVAAGQVGAEAQQRANNTDWTQYHGGSGRTGYSATMPAFHGGLKIAKRIHLDGNVYASPIVANGVTIVATENNTVYAFGPRLHQLWKRHLGAPSPAAQRPCKSAETA